MKPWKILVVALGAAGWVTACKQEAPQAARPATPIQGELIATEPAPLQNAPPAAAPSVPAVEKPMAAAVPVTSAASAPPAAATPSPTPARETAATPPPATAAKEETVAASKPAVAAASATTPPSPPEKPSAVAEKPIAPVKAASATDYDSVTFDKLASFNFEMTEQIVNGEKDPVGAREKSDSQIPKTIKAFDKKRVALQGFMLPLKVEGGAVTEFLIMRDQSMCCYGTIPKINEWVSVKMVGGGVKPTMDQAITIYGTLHVGEMRENGYLVGIYRMDGDKMGSTAN